MSKPQPLLAVTMPTRNRPELLERALRSVLGALEPVATQVDPTAPTTTPVARSSTGS
jgi:hypothetical protein